MSISIILFRLLHYFKYWLLRLDEHSLQSPFLYQLYVQGLKRSKRKKIFNVYIEDLRLKLLKDQRVISFNSFGSGTRLFSKESNSVKAIARSGISSRSDSEVLLNLISFHNCKSVLELGTSLGINTCYLDKETELTKIKSIEGNIELSKIAKHNLEEINCDKVELINMDIDVYFDNSNDCFDLIYMDANHTYDATIRYFDKALKHLNNDGIIVIDDIYWTPEMHKAWSRISTNYSEHLFVENATIGIVFVNKKFNNNHYILNF